jgi:phosphonate degradation associated HDIG domain protein
MSAPPVELATSVDEVIALYVQWGPDHYDEELSQLDHALQTAALAVADGAADTLVVAALLHDVGHLLELRAPASESTTGPAPDLHHEARGARFLSELFPPAVTAPIALHVRAKRYLGAVEPGYLDSLSGGSTRSLVRQGGPMHPGDVAAFEANPGFADALRLRRWDDHGKIDGLVVPELDDYRPLLERCAVPGVERERTTAHRAGR